MSHKIQNLHPDVRIYRTSAKKIKCRSEIEEQIELYQWFKVKAYPELEQALFYVPNEAQGQKKKVNGKWILTGGALAHQSKMNRAGRSAGVSDLILLHQTEKHPYAIIEMKSLDGTSMPTPEEKVFLNYHAERGAFVCICWGAEQGKIALNDYLQ